MRKAYLVLLINFLVFNTFAQNIEYKEYFDDGTLKVEGFKDKNGKETGEWKMYYDNGKIKEIGNYLEGQKTSEWKQYDKNGQLVGQLNLDKKLTEERPITEQIQTSSPKPSVAEEDLGVPFAVIENVPIYPGCESGNNNDEKKCMLNKITAFVNENFNTSLAGSLGLTGRQNVYVMFKIDVTGTIMGAQARAKHPKLEQEAVRVINLLPKMKPGTHKGKAVIVPYTMPIRVMVQE